MPRLFKSKEQKQKELQEELDKLQEKYSSEINSYCKIGDYIFILLGFKIDKNKICVKFEDKNTMPGYYTFVDMFWWELKWGFVDFKKMRLDFIKFKEDLNKIGLKLEKQ